MLALRLSDVLVGFSVSLMSFTLILSSEFVRYCPTKLMQHTLTNYGIDVAVVRIVNGLTFTFYYIILLDEILRPCVY